MDDAEKIGLIMVVDDDPDTVKILSHYLKREGFTPLEAASGPEGLRLLASHRVDVILLDLMMPEMDGFAVMRALKKDPATADIPVIMVTARDDLSARAEGMSLGVADFLAKPVFRKQLGNRIRAQLEIVATGHATAATLNRIEAVPAKR
ncbi:MAG TPA: response regulator [Candidatus Binataceae bacterium]|jgi:DNA-binding response OmpR family regulator|nr:response regulator [Candidatus Binataceae bacterium]